MEQVLIGSKAIQHHFSDFNRTPKDTDYAISKTRVKGGDCMVIPLVIEASNSEVASPELLLTLKISHIFFNPLGERNWEKHMWDIQFLLSKGISYDWGLMLKLKEFWTQHYGGLRRSNLTLDADKFFDNAINGDLDHDELHTYLTPTPAYTKVLKDGAEVEPCPTKYRNLSNKDKDALIQEEVMVMAYERFSHMYYKKAYFTMFKKYLRSHVPMFSLDYMIRNYIRLGRPPYNFIEKINERV